MNYDYECKKCGNTEEHTVSYAKRKTVKLSCQKCGGKLTYIFPTARLCPDRFPYTHTNLAPQDVVIRDRKHEAAEFAARGVYRK